MAKSGDVPTMTEVRAAPASRTAKVKRNCEMPGPRSPASRNGQTSVVNPPWRERERQHDRDGDEHGEERAALGERALPKGDSHRHRRRPEDDRGREREQTASTLRLRFAPAKRRSTRAAAGSAITIPAIITAQPSQPAQPSTSSASSTPASAANGASSVNTSAARAAVVCACTQVAMR